MFYGEKSNSNVLETVGETAIRVLDQLSVGDDSVLAKPTKEGLREHRTNMETIVLNNIKHHVRKGTKNA